MLGRFFRKKEKKGCTSAEAMRLLRENETTLLRKQEWLQEKIDNQIKIAKANGTKNKRVALKALREKKRYEKQLQEIDGTLTALEKQRETLEGAIDNAAVLKVLKLGSESLKKANNHLDVDEVHDIMGHIAEQLNISRELSDSIKFGQDISEEDLEQELEKLEQDALDDKLLELPSASLQLPSPVHGSVGGKVPAKPTSADDEILLKELSSWSS